MAYQEKLEKSRFEFDFTSFPEDTLFYERRTGEERREPNSEGDEVSILPIPNPERRQRKDRRRRIDPTTFEKQYSHAEMEFMTAMQRYKVQSGKQFPTHGEVLKVALELGYRKSDSGNNGDSRDTNGDNSFMPDAPTEAKPG